MITNWEQFLNAVARMREYQKFYSESKTQFALDMAVRFEKEIDECIAERRARTRAQSKLAEEDTNGKA